MHGHLRKKHTHNTHTSVVRSHTLLLNVLLTESEVLNVADD